MSEYECLEYEVADGVARIRLDRPEVLNALNRQLTRELTEAVGRAADTEGVRVIVLSGKGRAFSAGYDIGSAAEGPEAVEEKLRNPRDHLEVIFGAAVPVVAAVDGYALAGGCNLAVACDLTIATEGSQFGYPDMRFGEPPPKFVLPFVTNSLKHARELLYTGKMISAGEAERMGLVNLVVPDGELDEAVEEEVGAIKKTPGIAVTMVKEMINEVQEAQGYHRGHLDEFLGVLSMETDTPKRFREIRDEEGLEAALEWTHAADKE